MAAPPVRILGHKKTHGLSISEAACCAATLQMRPGQADEALPVVLWKHLYDVAHRFHRTRRRDLGWPGRFVGGKNRNFELDFCCEYVFID